MFKRISVFLIAAITLFSFSLLNKKPIFSDFADEFNIYFGSGASNSRSIIVSEERFIFYSDVCGESCEILENEIDVQEFFSRVGAKLILVEQTEEQTSYYGYNPKIKHAETIGGNRINVHLSVAEGRVRVGSPIIYGSF